MRPSSSCVDFRLGVRMLVKYPGLTLVGVLGMAITIAIGASVFSVLATMFNATLPVAEGERVVAIRNQNVAAGYADPRTHLHDLRSWRAGLRAVEELGAYRVVERNLIGPDGGAEPARVAEMSATGFRVARVDPLLGRYLVAEDEEARSPAVVVIGYSVWRTRFAGDPGVIGETVQIGAVPHTVVGVMPEGFAFPVNDRVWAPLRLDPSDYAPGEAPALEVFGRLAPGADLEQAQAQLTTLGQRLAAEQPDTHEHIRPVILPYTRAMFGSAGLPWEYHLFQFVVGLLLVVIAVNVAILVYARTATRTGEITVRLALGASRGRVVFQLFAEALVLSAAAVAVGLAAAALVLRTAGRLISRLGGDSVPFWWDFGLDLATVVYGAGLAVGAAAIIGALPALKVTGQRLQADLRQLGGGTGMRMGRTWTALIVAQVAIAVTVLPLAGALGWNEFFRSGIAGPGFAMDGLVSARLGLDRDTPPSAEAEAYGRELASRFADRQAELARRLESEFAASAVTFTSHVPGDWIWASGASGTIEVEDPRPAAAPTRHHVRHLQSDPHLFEVYGIAILTGRSFGAADLAGAANAVIVNRSFVEQVLDGGAALGRRVRYERAEGAPGGWYEIVGVVNDFPAKRTVNGLGVAMLYHPAAPGGLDAVSLVARARGIEPERFAARLREITVAVDPALRLTDVRPVAQLYRERVRSERVLTLAIAVATLSVLLLSAAGIHALMSFTVAQRRKEIGIRSALGAHPRRMLGGIFARALRQLATGVAIGCALAATLMLGDGFPAGRAAVLLLGVAAIVLCVGLLAALGPARRALRIEPTEALRADA